MSITTCALSGQPLLEPIVSTKSGHVFEKSLILKQLKMTGQCPITGQNLDAQTDLVELKVAAHAAPLKPLDTMSFPATLKFLQEQWDTQMLEVYQLRQSLDQTRKELSHSLYQHDAACQVICRLETEKEHLSAQLDNNQSKFEELKQNYARMPPVQQQQQVSEESKQVEAPSTLSQALIEQMNALSDKLIEQRKQQKPPASYPQRENIGAFTETANSEISITQNGTVDTLDISTAPSGAILVTTSENQIKILDSNGVLSETIPIDKRVQMAKFAPNSDKIAIFAFQKGAQVWDLHQKQKLYEIEGHAEQISDVCFTPLEGMVAVSSSDGQWSMHDYNGQKQLLIRREPAKVSSLKFHPDGLIMAVGYANGRIVIYDVRDMVVAQELDGPVDTEVKQLEFSNKGIFLAAYWSGSDTCRVYSLHKGFAFAEIKQSGLPITSMSFDIFGGFLAIGTNENMTISNYKNWKKTLKTMTPFETGVQNIRFDSSGKKLFVSNEKIGVIKTLSLP